MKRKEKEREKKRLEENILVVLRTVRPCTVYL